MRQGVGFSLKLRPRSASALEFCLLLLLVLTWTSPALAAAVTLRWDPNPETTLSGYRLYYGTASRNYTTLVDVGNRTTYAVTGLAPGTYYFAVTAYDILGNESGFSDEVFTTAPPACSYSISPATQSFTGDGGTGTVSVTSPAGCGWSAASSADWITITTDSGGSGYGRIEFAVSPNTTPGSRSGVISIAGLTFTVTQSGAGCSYVISPGTGSFTSAGGTGTVSVTSPAGCTWTATSKSDWITITAGSGGSGYGNVEYAVSRNTTPGSRSGALSIAGLTFTLFQEGESFTHSLYFAQFADGAQWVSSIILTNPSRTETATGLIQLVDDQGQSLNASINDQAATSTVPFSIPPLGSARFATAGLGDLVVGSVRLVSNVEVGGIVRYSHPALGVAAVGASIPLRALMTEVARDGRGGRNTGIALRNSRTSDLSLQLFLRDLNGGSVPSGFASLTIPGGGHVAKFVDQFFPAADTSDFQGTLAVTALEPDAAIAATAIQLGPGEFTTLPVVAVDPPTASSELYFAHFANGSGWTTSMLLANPSDSASASVLSFFDDDGSRMTVPGQTAGDGVHVDIQPRGAALISTDGSGDLVSGSARVTGSGAIAGVLRFSSRALGLTGVGSGVPTAGFIVPVSLGVNERWSTGLAVASTAAQVKVSLTLRDQLGQPVSGGQLELVLRANGHMARFLEELFPNADTRDFQGTLTVTAEGGTIVGTAIQVAFQEGRLTTLPVTELR